MLKTPEKGRVKTRLAEDLGSEQATLLYERMLAYAMEQLQCVPFHVQLWWDGNPEFLPTATRSFDLFRQQGDSLGDRMKHAFAYSFSTYPNEPAVIIGIDCPDLFSDQLYAAFEQLSRYDTVIGPSMDGGYYLLGMHRLHPELFEGIAWSTPTVCQATIDRIHELGLSAIQLPQLQDIDTADDLNQSQWYYDLDKKW